jgi:branched-chain amino acid transport system permease protein
MNEFLQQIINGLTVGAIYALIALGYTMIYGVLRFINFAHGDVFMVGAYIGLYVYPLVGGGVGNEYVVAIAVMLAAMIGCGLLGVTIEYLAYRRLRNRPKLTVLITAIGVSLFLEYTGQLPVVFGPNTRTFPTLLAKTPLNIATDLTISTIDVMVFVVAILLMLLLRIIVLRTKIGTAMRAVSMNLNAASLMGININRVISFTFFLGSSLAGAGSILYAMNYPKITPLLGILPGLKAFVAAVLGGIGNIPGAAVGGFFIGIAETLTAGYLAPTYRDAIVFGILILVLIFKPSGLFGKSGGEKA